MCEALLEQRPFHRFRRLAASVTDKEKLRLRVQKEFIPGHPECMVGRDLGSFLRNPEAPTCCFLLSAVSAGTFRHQLSNPANTPTV